MCISIDVANVGYARNNDCMMSKSIFPETLTVRFRATWAAVSVYSPCTPMIRVQILPKSTIFLLKLLLNRTKINKKKTGLALNIESTSINISGVNAKSLEIWNLRTNEVKMLMEEVPPSIGSKYGLPSPQEPILLKLSLL